MDERTTGLIFRTRPLTDTSMVVQWLTADFGRVATVAKGAHRPQSPFRGKLDTFFLCDFSFRRSRHSELHTLREVSLVEAHEPLRRDMVKLQQVAYCTALIEQTTEIETPLPTLYPLVTGLVEYVARHTAPAQIIFAFEMKLLTELGLKPDLEEKRLTAGTRQLLGKLVTDDWPLLDRLKLSEAQATEIRQFLHGYLIFHLGRMPHGRASALKTGEK